VSGHSLLFAYFILRRLFIRIPDHSLAKAESMLAIILYIITGYVKVFWWSDPITVAIGTGIAIGLTVVSFYVLRGERVQRELQAR